MTPDIGRRNEFVFTIAIALPASCDVGRYYLRWEDISYVGKIFPTLGRYCLRWANMYLRPYVGAMWASTERPIALTLSRLLIKLTNYMNNSRNRWFALNICFYLKTDHRQSCLALRESPHSDCCAGWGNDPRRLCWLVFLMLNTHTCCQYTQCHCEEPMTELLLSSMPISNASAGRHCPMGSDSYVGREHDGSIPT
jgi:hypothetical protein